jgi:tyrosine-protein kinase
LNGPGDESVLHDWLSVLSRQKWIVLLALTVAPLLAFAASQSQQRLYQASATVLLNQQDPATAEALSIATAPSSPPDRYAATQAKLARVPTVAAMAVRASRLPHRTAAGVLASTSVSADPTDDLLTFSATDPNPALAARLANAYAGAFTAYRHRLDTEALSAALRDTQRKLAAITASGGGGSGLFRRVAATQRGLENLQTLQAASSSASLVGRASRASLAQPKTKRNVILGLIAGLALGIALAFLRQTLDTRVRSAEELRTRLGVPLLGQLPRSRGRTPAMRLTALSDPAGPGIEAYRILKNNLETAQLGHHHAGSIAITSAGAEEDGAAIAGNLGVVLARSGRRVILVDLNLREPGLAQLFGLPERPGLTSVANGVMLLDALRPVEFRADRARPNAGSLQVMTAGRPPADPGDFLQASLVPDALTLLGHRCDVLLTVTSPLLSVGDAMTIAPHVDALILVAGVDRVRGPALAEIRGVLERCPTPTLGVVATGGGAAEAHVPAPNRNGHAEGLAPSHASDAPSRLLAAISASIGARLGHANGNGMNGGPPAPAVRVKRVPHA